MSESLVHPIVFQTPRRLTDSTAWQGHIPFAFAAVWMAQPRTIVELGTAYGDSYCAFCQAVEELGLPTRATAVDTWLGDPHSGALTADAYAELREYHDPLYGHFSQLLRSDFDEALAAFATNTIDLLHIDGYHTYQAVCHDFNSWRPKLSDRAVVLLHDTEVRESDFGVCRLWDELSTMYPSYAFRHGNGLGVLAVGSNVPSTFLKFLDEANSPSSTMGSLFSALGERLCRRSVERVQMKALEKLELELEECLTRIAAASETVERLAKQLAEEKAHRLLAESHLSAASETVERLAKQLAEEKAHRLLAGSHLEQLLATRTFRYSARARGVYGRLRRRSMI